MRAFSWFSREAWRAKYHTISIFPKPGSSFCEGGLLDWAWRPFSWSRKEISFLDMWPLEKQAVQELRTLTLPLIWDEQSRLLRLLVETASPCNSEWWQVDSIQYRLIYTTTSSGAPFGGWMDISNMFQTELPVSAPPAFLPLTTNLPPLPLSPSQSMATPPPGAQTRNTLEVSLSFPATTLLRNPLVSFSKYVKTLSILSTLTTTILIQATITSCLDYWKKSLPLLPLRRLFLTTTRVVLWTQIMSLIIIVLQCPHVSLRAKTQSLYNDWQDLMGSSIPHLPQHCLQPVSITSPDLLYYVSPCCSHHSSHC